MMKIPQRNVSRGFTLIELLVVVAIIALLAAILFPVFGRARENARRSACQSNLKQLGLGLLQYTQDYDEKFPPIQAVSSDIPGWSYMVQPYVKSVQILQCPSDSSPVGTNPYPAAADATGYTDYAFNSLLNRQSQALVSVPSLTISLVETQTWLSQDASDGCNNNGDFDPSTNACSPGAGTLSPTVSTTATISNGTLRRHLEGANYTFCDGHVKWFKGMSDTQSGAVLNGAPPLSTETKARFALVTQ